jgi:hypothetical protein
MPAVFRERGFRFFFYSDEGDPREPPHVHVHKNGADAKFWLFPDVALAYNAGFDPRTLAWLFEQVSARRQMIEKVWHEHFG